MKKKSEKLIVQKSNPLLSLCKSEITLSEFKILDVYLSRINSHEPEKRLVRFEKGELEKLLGVTRINHDDLEKRLEHLIGNVVRVEDSEYSEGIHIITLFNEAFAKKDDSGNWIVDLECSAQAMKYIFNIEKLGYLRYKLRCVTSLKSKYSYVMFLYLESNRFRGEWEVPLDELKKILGCDEDCAYEKYYRFNDLILKKCFSELNEKTECRYEYSAVKRGRTITAVNFNLLPFSDPGILGPEPVAKAMPEIPEKIKNTEDVMHITARQPVPEIDSLLQEFGENQKKELLSLMDSLPGSVTGGNKYLYLSDKLALMDSRNDNNQIINRYSYLRTIIRNDIKAYSAAAKPSEPESKPANSSSFDTNVFFNAAVANGMKMLENVGLEDDEN